MKYKNNININNDYAEMFLESPTHGKFITITDLEDIDKIDEEKWIVNKYKYGSNGNEYCKYYALSIKNNILLHRLIMDAPKGKDVDHRDGDTMNNRKDNLRICARQ